MEEILAKFEPERKSTQVSDQIWLSKTVHD
jgi:hypothetical protein